jgi:hypothetical protein
MLKKQQASPELQNALPRSKQVDPKFQHALKAAIQNYRVTKSPLWRHQRDEIVIMERVVSNANQTNRELRDGAGKACQQINSSWRNWVIRSLLTDYVKQVLDDPRFNVEGIYEAVIDRLGITIDLQDKVIKKLEQDNENLRKDPDLHDQDLRKKLEGTENFLIEAQDKLAQAQKKIDQCENELIRSRQLNESLGTILEANQKNHQGLYKDYVHTVDEKQPIAKKQFKTPAPEVGRVFSEKSLGAKLTPTKISCV